MPVSESLASSGSLSSPYALFRARDLSWWQTPPPSPATLTGTADPPLRHRQRGSLQGDLFSCRLPRQSPRPHQPANCPDPEPDRAVES